MRCGCDITRGTNDAACHHHRPQIRQGADQEKVNELVAATLVYGLIYYFKDARTGQTVIASILEASPALMCAIVLSSLFLRVFIQLQLWHGVVFGIVRHQRKV
jgi:hypothetical protein